jgi:hypothetical protein
VLFRSIRLTDSLFPFNRIQLMNYDPVMFALLETLWSRPIHDKP